MKVHGEITPSMEKDAEEMAACGGGSLMFLNNRRW
jgi:hypothetical protein